MTDDKTADSSSSTRVSVYCVHFDGDGRVLLVKDANSLLWGFPGGGIDAGETHDDALHRELTEETGLIMRGSSTYIARQESGTRLRHFYKIEYADGQLNETGNGDDILEAGYFDVRSLPSDMAIGVEKIIVQQVTLLR